jgi:hypothetical protein
MKEDDVAWLKEAFQQVATEFLIKHGMSKDETFERSKTFAMADAFYDTLAFDIDATTFMDTDAPVAKRPKKRCEGTKSNGGQCLHSAHPGIRYCKKHAWWQCVQDEAARIQRINCARDTLITSLRAMCEWLASFVVPDAWEPYETLTFFDRQDNTIEWAMKRYEAKHPREDPPRWQQCHWDNATVNNKSGYRCIQTAHDGQRYCGTHLDEGLKLDMEKQRRTLSVQRDLAALRERQLLYYARLPDKPFFKQSHDDEILKTLFMEPTEHLQSFVVEPTADELIEMMRVSIGYWKGRREFREAFENFVFSSEEPSAT